MCLFRVNTSVGSVVTRERQEVGGHTRRLWSEKIRNKAEGWGRRDKSI